MRLSGDGESAAPARNETGILFANPAPGKVRFHTAKSKHSSPRRCELPRRPEYAEGRHAVLAARSGKIERRKNVEGEHRASCRERNFGGQIAVSYSTRG